MDKEKKTIEYFYRWIRLGQIGIDVEKLLLDRGIKTIGLYGFCQLSKSVVYELDNSRVKVMGIIDRRAKDIVFANMKMLTVENISNLDVDAILVCPVDLEKKIIANINEYKKIKTITFEELLYEL